MDLVIVIFAIILSSAAIPFVQEDHGYLVPFQRLNDTENVITASSNLISGVLAFNPFNSCK